MKPVDYLLQSFAPLILQFIEEERAKDTTNFWALGFVYDEMFKRDLDERAKKKRTLSWIWRRRSGTTRRRRCCP